MKIVYLLAGLLVGAFTGFGLALNEIQCSDHEKSSEAKTSGYDEVFKAEEEGYLKGQKAALNNDIRIKKVNDQWVFIKSPWVTDTIYNNHLDFRP